jgi:hypothetical protein
MFDRHWFQSRSVHLALRFITPGNKFCSYALISKQIRTSTAGVGYLVPIPEHLRKIAALFTHSRSRNFARFADAALSFHVERSAFSPDFEPGKQQVTDAQLRMGLTQHTVRSGAAMIPVMFSSF